MTLVSVVIPCHNAAQSIQETLLSIQRQGVTDLEVVLVDDGSTDGSAEIAGQTLPHLRIERVDRMGASAARNLGTRRTSGTYIQYLDADDLLAPGKLDRQVQLLEQTGADVAYGDWQRLEEREGSYLPADIISRTLNDPEIDLFTDFWCPPAAYLFRRSLVERTDGWNPHLPIIQDARFALDCALNGGRFVRCEGLMALYRVHTGGSLSTREPVLFVRDCLTNALEIEAYWRGHGGIDRARTAALTKTFGFIARSSYESDRATFDVAHEGLERVDPGYVPNAPRHMAMASRLLGYRRAEFVALWYRRARRRFRIESGSSSQS